MLKLAAPLAVLVMLGGIGIDRASREAIPPGAEVYHARVREAVEQIPYRIGDWVGVDEDIHEGALKILDSNVALSRAYRNIHTGHSATLLVVQCPDARNLLGHYPPVCYPSQGWTQVSAEPRDVATESLDIDGTEYSFEYASLSQAARLGVLHAMVLPDGRIAPDMELMEESAKDKSAKFFGGASLQFVVDANLSTEERQEIYETLIEAAAPWIESVRSGVGS